MKVVGLLSLFSPSKKRQKPLPVLLVVIHLHLRCYLANNARKIQQTLLMKFVSFLPLLTFCVCDSHPFIPSETSGGKGGMENTCLQVFVCLFSLDLKKCFFRFLFN